MDQPVYLTKKTKVIATFRVNSSNLDGQAPYLLKPLFNDKNKPIEDTQGTFINNNGIFTLVNFCAFALACNLVISFIPDFTNQLYL